uniref:Uncharacterized protein At3g06530-like n=1 Tax=Rhizophora mucronata TaxID=61149 RepID=A0A2P2LZ66_RHIMU
MVVRTSLKIRKLYLFSLNTPQVTVYDKNSAHKTNQSLHQSVNQDFSWFAGYRVSSSQTG